MLILAFAFALSFLLALYGTPIAAQTARKYGIVDQPDGHLKVQKEPVPYLGGLAIYLSFILTYGIVFDYGPRVLGILLSASIVVMLGLLDDIGALTPKVKFLGQLLVGFVLVRSDIVIKLAALPDWLNIALSLFWVIGLMNAFNIIDIMDGLAGGIAAIASVVFLVISVINGETLMGFVSVALLGSVLGFLRYNFSPAKIYMGDAGSMLLGLILASFALIGDYSERNWLGFVSPIFILSVPIFDTVYVSVLRIAKKKPFYFGSKDHYALRLLKKCGSVPKTVYLSYLISFVGGGLGIANMFATPTATIFMLAGTILFFAVFGVWLASEPQKQ